MSAGAPEASTRPPWRVAGALAVTQVVHWGSLFYAFSVLMPAIAAETGWAREAAVGAFSTGLLAQAVVTLAAGLLLDRLGARAVMTVGSTAAGIGLWLAGQVEAIWQLYLVWAGLGVVMAATLYEAAFAAVTAAFGTTAARRGIAVVVFAGGLASTVFWPLTGLLVEQLGWRDACTALAAMNALCAVPHAILLPGRGAARRQAMRAGGAPQPGLPQACRQPRFWALALVYAALGAGSSAVAVHLVPLLQERGAGAGAAALAGLVGVAQVAGRIAEFVGAGRWSLRQVGATALAALPVAFAVLAWGGQPLLLAAGVILYGAANGTMTIVRGALPAQMFGAAHYGAIAGGLAACGAFARAVGPLAVAWLWERGGTYTPAMLALALLVLVALGAFAVATRPR